MLEAFGFAKRQPKDHRGLLDQLSGQRRRVAADREDLTGVVVGEGQCTPGNAAAFSEQRFARSFIMESIAAGKEPRTGAKLQEAIDKEREQVRKTLEKKYGEAK